MTLNQLHKAIEKLLAKHPNMARWEVLVNKPSFTHPLEQDGCVYLPIDGITWDAFPVIDGDGYTATNKDGSERFMRSVVIYGGAACKHNRIGDCVVCSIEAGKLPTAGKGGE